jgi:Mrp family chromosome partitioning ATPase
MSTPRKPGLFGELPPGAGGERRPAPLPLVTQPMLAADGSPIAAPGDGHLTSVDHSAPPFGGAAGRGQAPSVDPSLAVFGRPTSLSSPVRSQAAASASAHPLHAPPEIALSQHHLPDEPPDPRLAMVIDPDSERAASFRVLRHHLLELGRPQVIVVSSPRPGDGKTTVAMNLALALAECGRAKVLLAEANVRHPALAGALRLVPTWCFAEQLAAHRHQPQLPWTLIEIPQLWLHVAAVSPRIEKSQLLDAPAFAIAMERLRVAGYEHIVIDAPAVLGSADVNLMADAADAVLLAARARRTTARDLRKAVDQIGADKVIGSVLVEG